MFDSVLGRGVSAAGRTGMGATLSLGLHALALALALVVSGTSGPKPSPIETVHFPKRPTPGPHARPAPGPTRPPTSQPTRPDRIRPPTERPAAPPAAEFAEPSVAAGALDAPPAGPGDEVVVDGSGETPGESPPVWLDGPRVSLPRLLSGPEPAYPAEAARERIAGTVLVRCTVTEHGTVEDCAVVKSLPLLDTPVLQALRARRYAPALAEGRPVAVRMVFTVRVVPP